MTRTQPMMVLLLMMMMVEWMMMVKKRRMLLSRRPLTGSEGRVGNVFWRRCSEHQWDCMQTPIAVVLAVERDFGHWVVRM